MSRVDESDRSIFSVPCKGGGFAQLQVRYGTLVEEITDRIGLTDMSAGEYDVLDDS